MRRPPGHAAPTPRPARSSRAPRRAAANARAAYTRALALEAPNKKVTATLYYNRSGCNQKLRQPHLALRDAQLSAEADPLNARAWWRAADAARALGDAESAREAIKAGLTVSPRCAALKALSASLDADARGL